MRAWLWCVVLLFARVAVADCTLVRDSGQQFLGTVPYNTWLNAYTPEWYCHMVNPNNPSNCSATDSGTVFNGSAFVHTIHYHIVSSGADNNYVVSAASVGQGSSDQCPASCSANAGRRYSVSPVGGSAVDEGTTQCVNDGCTYKFGPASTFQNYVVGGVSASQTAVRTGDSCDIVGAGGRRPRAGR